LDRYTSVSSSEIVGTTRVQEKRSLPEPIRHRFWNVD
jgi:hypothetical protein